MTATVPTITLPPTALKALRILDESGCEAWCVGGFVRDALMGRAVHDVDIATEAPWQRTEEIFSSQGYPCFETGTAFGTLTVLVDEMPFEITTFRKDADYRDGRHPSEVSFVSSIDEDLARRDFTMNAIAFHPARGLHDPFQGRDDIANGIIRAVGDPDLRFSEDALRMLRAVRFVSQLGFSLDRHTLSAMNEHRDGLSRVAAERVAAELEGILKGAYAHDAIMGGIEVLGASIPELLALEHLDQKTPYHLYDALEHTAFVVQNAPSYRLVRWAALLHDIGKPRCFTIDDAGTGHFFGHPAVSAEMCRNIMGRLKMSGHFIEDTAKIILLHDAGIDPTVKAVKRTLRKLDGRTDLLRALIDLKIADALAQTPGLSDHLEKARALSDVFDEFLASGSAFRIADLAIDGNDLQQVGFSQGPAIGKALDAALTEVIEERVPNERGELLAFLLNKR